MAQSSLPDYPDSSERPADEDEPTFDWGLLLVRLVVGLVIISVLAVVLWCLAVAFTLGQILRLFDGGR
jgi:hypothetical protein